MALLTVWISAANVPGMKHIERAVKIAGSQQALAEKCDVTQSLVSQWVNGEVSIDVKHFRSISKAANGEVTPENLLQDEMNRAAQQKRRRIACDR